MLIFSSQIVLMLKSYSAPSIGCFLRINSQQVFLNQRLCVLNSESFLMGTVLLIHAKNVIK